MYQLIYAGTATQEFSPADLKKLLVAARMRNKDAGVTGMLVFHDGTFLQALEGDKRAVDEIFASIKTDPRHRDVQILHRGPLPGDRVFGAWSMGFVDFTGAASILKGFVRFNEQLKQQELDAARALDLLTACAHETAGEQA